ncbi:MAG: 3'(2'),5'-bisphosphate nucleotidase CysQ [Nitrospirae bacterium]|nr:3'(2'),5'-bisphosphate nucleotidase CysQ [Magnetococcales bacterium]HAT50624.1 3'(2'),5'-bisphosphate nucleotidase CysQ [Alphaproteobacteria bacterium]
MDHTDIHLPAMIQAARNAGTRIMHYFRPGSDVSQSAGISHKGQDNPLTKADIEANETIQHTLMTAFPDYGWLSEEDTAPNNRLEKQRVWIVDPLDGTQEFIRGIPEFAVSIALAEAGQTIAACVFNPPLEALFTAVAGRGSRKNGKPIQTSRTTRLVGAVCLASNSETKRGDWEPFKNEFTMISLGSIAYKLATLASGQADLTFTLTPKNEWDIAAGELLVREAHGQITDKDGNRITFNQPAAKLRSVLATNGQLHPALLKRLANVPLNRDRR